MTNKTPYTNQKGVFLYSPLVEQVKNSLLDKSHFYFYGGPKTGKTTFLNVLKDKLKVEEIYYGRNQQSMGRMLKKIGEIIEQPTNKKDFNKFILIDDLDFYTINSMDTQQMSSVDFLNDITNWAGFSEQKIIATGQNEPDKLIEDIQSNGTSKYKVDKEKLVEYWSSIPSKYKIHQLSPWSTFLWEKILMASLSTELLPVNKKLKLDTIQNLFKIVIKLTGAHPLLWGAATSQLKILCGQEESLSGFENGILTNYLKVHVQSEVLSTLRRILKKLNREDLLILNTVLKCQNIDQECPIGVNQVRHLINSALVRFNIEDGKLNIPGEILIDELSQIFEEAKLNKPICFILEDKQNPKKKGKIIIKTETEEYFIELKGSTWLIMKSIFNANGKIVTPDELKTIGSFKNKTGVRSAINRIEEIIRKHPITPIIENIHGEGYKFSEPKIKV